MIAELERGADVLGQISRSLGKNRSEPGIGVRGSSPAAATLTVLSASFPLTTGELSVVAGAPHLTMAVVAEYRRRYPGVRLVTTFGNRA